jgi:hypothetical protein
MWLAIPCIVLIALTVLGGMTITRGFLDTADISAIGIEKLATIDGEINRTAITPIGATGLSWANSLRLVVANTGQTKLAAFEKWDVIIEYYDAEGTRQITWLPYIEGKPTNNEWAKTAVYVNGQPEVFEPNILNPGEEIVFDAKLSPTPQEGTVATASISTPTGVQGSISLTVSPPVLTAHSETTLVSGTKYYRLKEGTGADGVAATMSSEIPEKATGRWLLYNESDTSRPAKYVYPLKGIEEIPASTWTIYYRAQAIGDWPRNPSISVDIVIRKADGTIRQTIATNVAQAQITDRDTWQTIFATYSFAGYTVVNDTDYLEIQYYGNAITPGPRHGSGYIRLLIDDNSLPGNDQTKVDT